MARRLGLGVGTRIEGNNFLCTIPPAGNLVDWIGLDWTGLYNRTGEAGRAGRGTFFGDPSFFPPKGFFFFVHKHHGVWVRRGTHTHTHTSHRIQIFSNGHLVFVLVFLILRDWAVSRVWSWARNADKRVLGWTAVVGNRLCSDRVRLHRGRLRWWSRSLCRLGMVCRTNRVARGGGEGDA